MPDIYEYTDHKKYLTDFYNEQKAKNRHFSYQVLAEKAGFTNKGFVYNLIHGTKHLSKTSIYKLCSAFKLTKAESEYFENMVACNQARDPGEQGHFLQRMITGRRRRTNSSLKIVHKDQYEFYSCWYYSAVWSLIEMYRFNGNYQWLVDSIYPAIRLRDAKMAVDVLLRQGLVERGPDGSFSVTSTNLSTGLTITGTEVLNYHLDNLHLASIALKKVHRNRRNVAGLTLGISEATYSKIVDELRAFQDKIMELAGDDNEADRVYQLNFQLFPLTDSNVKGMNK